MNEAIRFADYEVMRREDGTTMELGRGAMGITYKAWDSVMHGEVALKVINQSLFGSPEDRDRFLEEVGATKQLHHPNIATLFHLGLTENDEVFCAMEFCEGPTLEQAIQADGPFSAREALCIAGQVTLALIAAEERGWRHGDLKPANLILTESHAEGQVVKLIEFGLARNFNDGRQALALLGSSGLAGTAYFASPEQLEEKDNLDIRSDIYSLGGCLWFALTGHPPFEGPLALAMSRTLFAELPWESLAAQPKPVIALLKRMLARKPDDRPPSAAALLLEIEKCLQEEERPSETPLVQSEFPALAAEEAPASPLSLRFQPVEEIAHDATGRLFRAIHHARQGTYVWFRLIDPELTTRQSTWRDLQAQITAAHDHPHPRFINIITAETTVDGLAIVQEYVKGISLFECIEACGEMAPEDALMILQELAPAADHAANCGVAGLCLSKKRVFVHFPDSPAEVSFRHILALPHDEWPRFEIKADVISLGEAESTVPGLAGDARGREVAALAGLACELLGGQGGPAFAPIAQLNETANRVLRFACTVEGAFPSAHAFVEALNESIGNSTPASEPTHSPSEPPPAPNPPSASEPPPAAPRKSALKRGLILAALLAIFVGDGLGYYYYIYLPREQDSLRRVGEAADQERALAEQQRQAEEAAKAQAAADQERASKEQQRQAEMAAKAKAAAETKVDLKTAKPAEPASPSPAATPSPATTPAPSPVEIVATDNPEAAGYRVKATAGDVEAARKLGLLYYDGHGVPKDPAQALKWLQMAADHGDAEAQTRLGTMYFNGWGVAKDYNQALRWHQKAADQGNGEGLAHLGAMYAAGWGVPRDYGQALKLIQKAADQGNADGETSLGAMYRSGLGVTKDYGQALSWFQKAADQGNAVAQSEMGILYAKGQGVPQDYAEALICFQKAADQGDVGAQNSIGELYENGWGLPKDYGQALSWYQKAADQGDPAGQVNIGRLYANGWGVPKNNDQAIQWYQKAVAAGDSGAALEIQKLKETSEGAAKSPALNAPGAPTP